ncbi:response regulator [Haloarculaceae archaeon H-GB2-1]|nr:response regulator [Haloarculaceae archaeon H-GB1-1]MEA5386802.1 response regulator [Haloarculaceae archaeon H-GB11]MEA5408277.1 response regulator [Haloarculaceae archaeon H-GB2-1]
MTENYGTSADVLIVEDERALADLYTEWLADTYSVRAAYEGEQAIGELEEAVDIVLLDRGLPDIPDDEILDHIRKRDVDCRVVMVTAVEPGLDSIDLEFDDYLIKPVDDEDLRTTVERMEQLATYDDLLQELYQCLVTRSVLLEKDDIEITDHESYSDLQDRIETLQDQIEVTSETFDTGAFEAAFRDLKEPHSHD